MDDFMDRFAAEVEREVRAGVRLSPLAEWMATHHAEAARLLNHQNMDWSRAAALFAQQGLRDDGDRLPNAATARETWLRVEARRRSGLKLRGGKR